MRKPADRQARPFIIGVTGNIACGKSSVMSELARLGADTIDADHVYHQLIIPSSPLWNRLVERFGREIVTADGQIDRRALGGIVFSDSAKLAELEQLTHPAIRAEILDRVTRSQAAVLAIDAVKLIEGNMHRDCDSVWLVTCRPDQQMQRLMSRNGLSAEDGRRRVAAQPAVGPKLELADVHIDNSGAIEATHSQVRQAWTGLGLHQREV